VAGSNAGFGSQNSAVGHTPMPGDSFGGSRRRRRSRRSRRTRNHRK
jgi:hypothetical protein